MPRPANGACCRGGPSRIESDADKRDLDLGVHIVFSASLRLQLISIIFSAILRCRRLVVSSSSSFGYLEIHELMMT